MIDISKPPELYIATLIMVIGVSRLITVLFKAYKLRDRRRRG